MRTLLIVNATASSVTPRARVVIQKALAADHDLAVVETSRRGHAERLARGAAHDGTEVVVAMGGDGTLNEAANGLAGSTTALAPLPGGSTNVFARTIGISRDPLEATGQLLASLHRHSYRRIGLGAVNGRRFLFHAGLGFDAAVVAQVERRNELKRYAGHPLFVYAGFTTWARHYDRNRPRFAVHFDADVTDGSVVGGSVVDDGYLTIVMNTNPYTYLGNRPLDLAPETTLDRGLTSVTLRTMSAPRLLRIVGSALTNGKALRRSRWVDIRSDIDGLTIRAYGPVPYQVDGDYLGEVEELTFRHAPEIIDLVLP